LYSPVVSRQRKKIEKSDGPADWVSAWSNEYGLARQIDARILGGTYPLYEKYWTSIQAQSEKPAWIANTPPAPEEREWADFAQRTPH